MPFVKITDIDEGHVFKCGKNYPLSWTSGNLSGHVNIELFSAAGERLWGENNVSNVGKFDWFLLASIKKGSDYILKFTNSRDRNDVVYSSPFFVKPKIPLLVKIASIVVVAAAVEIVVASNGNSTADAAKPMLDPPAPPNN